MITYSIIKKSQLEGALRLDAEYYQPEYLDIANKLRANRYYKRFSEIIEGGNYGTLPDSLDYIKNNQNDFIYLIRGIDLRGVSITEKEIIKVPSKYFSKKVEAKFGDLLFLVKGATIDSEDSVAIVPKLSKPAIFNGSVFRPVLKKQILSEYLYVFMRTKYFYEQKRRLSSNVGIEYNSVEEIYSYDFLIPKLNFQENIKKEVLKVFDFLKESKKFYSEAEDSLLEELGLKNFVNKENLFSVVNLSDVKKANRIDAEYFQLKFNILLSKVKTEKLGKLVSIIKGFEPGSDEYQNDGKLFIRVSSISREGIIDKDQKYLSEKLYQKLKNDFEPKVGEILLTKDATPGIAYVVKEPIGAIICGGILKLKTKEGIEPEFLALCINSIIGKSQVERDAGGSVIAHWKPKQIKNLQIPILPKATQQKIADLVRKSYNARKKAKALLEEAKTKVEKLIENKN